MPWRQAVGMRNFAAHGYFAVKLPVVWETATNDVPPLRNQVAQILAAEFLEGEP